MSCSELGSKETTPQMDEVGDVAGVPDLRCPGDGHGGSSPGHPPLCASYSFT